MFGNMFRKNAEVPEVQVGATFRHTSAGNVVETAKVVDVGEDPQGVRHVTYDLKVEKARFAAYEERRTLGLESFSEHFQEAVLA